MTMPPPEQPPQPPQQPPMPPSYGAPQHQYPQHPAYPQQGAWGAPPIPPPPPPRRGLGAGAIVAIVAGALVGVVALGGVLFYATSDDKKDDRKTHASDHPSGRPSGNSSPGTAGPAPSSQRYRLTVPHSLAGGQYVLAKDVSQTMQDGIKGQSSGLFARHMKGVGGQYTGASGAESASLVAAGIYGEVTNPKSALDSMLRGMSESQGVHVTTPAREITPSGSQEPVTCEVMELTRSGGTASIYVCGWSDHSTVATVTFPSLTEKADLDALAKKTATVRDEMRVPLSS